MTWPIPVNVLAPTDAEITEARTRLADIDTHDQARYVIGYVTQSLHFAATAVHAEDRYAAFRRARAMCAVVDSSAPVEPDLCPETCCTSSLWREPHAHNCVQLAGHPGRHVSPHTTWGES